MFRSLEPFPCPPPFAPATQSIITFNHYLHAPQHTQPQGVAEQDKGREQNQDTCLYDKISSRQSIQHKQSISECLSTIKKVLVSMKTLWAGIGRENSKVNQQSVCQATGSSDVVTLVGEAFSSELQGVDYNRSSVKKCSIYFKKCKYSGCQIMSINPSSHS